ncbi:MAG TPA: hypothetical protein VLB00_04285 [Gemmatimonadales bacterium]|nr:hypothetical protein [Gemmatimonadales bacterium]
MLLSALALLSVAGPPPSGGLGVPAPVTTRYKVEIKGETTIDLSVMGAPVQVQTANLSAWLLIRLNDSAGGKSLYVKVDSLAFDGTAAVTRESLDSARGGEVRGFVNAANRVNDLSANNSSTLLGQIKAMMHSFFPRVKAGAKPGETWMDTTTVRDESGGNDLTTVIVTNYTAAGAETQAGVATVKLGANASSTVTGTMQSPQTGLLEVEGTTTTTGTVFLGPDGRLRGASYNSNHDQKVKLAMSPTPIPVKTIQTIVVTVLP